MKNVSLDREFALSTDSESAMCERAPLAKTMPSAISSEGLIIFLRSVASAIGGRVAGARHGAKFLDEIAHVGERFTLADAHPLHRGRVADADAEHEPPIRNFVNECNGLGEVLHVARVDRRDAGAEADLVGSTARSLRTNRCRRRSSGNKFRGIRAVRSPARVRASLCGVRARRPG